MKDRPLEKELKTWNPRKKLPYKGKEWNIKDLIIYLQKEIERLEKEKCKPKVSCLRKYEEYMTKKFIDNSS